MKIWNQMENVNSLLAKKVPLSMIFDLANLWLPVQTNQDKKLTQFIQLLNVFFVCEILLVRILMQSY